MKTKIKCHLYVNISSLLTTTVEHSVYPCWWKTGLRDHQMHSGHCPILYFDPSKWNFWHDLAVRWLSSSSCVSTGKQPAEHLLSPRQVITQNCVLTLMSVTVWRGVCLTNSSVYGIHTDNHKLSSRLLMYAAFCLISDFLRHQLGWHWIKCTDKAY